MAIHRHAGAQDCPADLVAHLNSTLAMHGIAGNRLFASTIGNIPNPWRIIVNQQNVSAFFRLVASDPHLAERVQDIPDVPDAPSRLIALAASVGLPFTLKDLHAARELVDAELHHLAGGAIRKWL